MLDRRVDDLGMSSLVSAISVDASVAQSVEQGLDSLVTGVRFSLEALTFHSGYTMGSLYISVYIYIYIYKFVEIREIRSKSKVVTKAFKKV